MLIFFVRQCRLRVKNYRLRNVPVSTFSLQVRPGFGKIIALTQQETENALLNAQCKEQEIYLAEALKREEQYRSFQRLR